LKTDVEKLQECASLTENTGCSNIKDQKIDISESVKKDIVSDSQKEVSDRKEGRAIGKQDEMGYAGGKKFCSKLKETMHLMEDSHKSDVGKKGGL